MKRESLAGFAAATALSLSLMLTPAGPAFAGVSNFSVTGATFVPGTNNKQVLVTGTVTCPSNKVLTIGADRYRSIANIACRTALALHNVPFSESF